jgi:hypothetical protein
MPSLPILHRRRRSNKALEAVDTIAKAWTALNLASAGSKAAKKGAKAYGVAKGTKVVGGSAARFAAVPVAIGGGLLVWRKVRGGSSDQPASSVTPAAHASTVSPPGGDSSGALTDPPAGEVNPPVGPRAAT